MNDPSTSPHVVIVEDEEILQKFLVYHVEHAGYRATPTSSGTEMFRVIETEPVDLILLDLGLPDGDGLSWAQKIRERGEIPIVVLTGRKGDDDRIMALGLGADDYLTKPCDPRELLLRMRNILERSGKARPAAGAPAAPIPASAPSPSAAPGAPRSGGRSRDDQPGERRRDSVDRRRDERSDRRGGAMSAPMMLVVGLCLGALAAGAGWYVLSGDEPPAETGSFVQQGVQEPAAPAQPQQPQAADTGAAKPQAPASSKQVAVTAQPPGQPKPALVEEKSDAPKAPVDTSGLQTEEETDRPVASTSYSWVLRRNARRCRACPGGGSRGTPTSSATSTAATSATGCPTSRPGPSAWPS
ncbi:MAG: response regulator transcription factor [Magnetovibrio sp.]|nr:response regulator transcription factor [Magnetovibrio sp.]